ncbi:MAG: PD-(D/E)XK nuclease family protein [Pseudomonadota bacterium]
MTHDAHNKLTLLPYADDPLAHLAERLLREQQDSLPRLEQVTVLLPDQQEAPRLRRLLLEGAASRGHHALLGPRIDAWRSWLAAHEVEGAATASDYRRELILLQALRQHSSLFGEGNLWALADSLLTLFDELTLSRIELPANLDAFTHQVANGYGLDSGQVEALEREAQLVHTLWHAWHQELQQRGLMDRNTRQLLQLGASVQSADTQPLYLLLPPLTSEAECAWLDKMVNDRGAQLLLHGHYAGPPPQPYHPEYPLQRMLQRLGAGESRCGPTDDRARFLDAVYAPGDDASPPLSERAAAFAVTQPQSPLAGKLEIFSAENDEEEAHAVELQVRRWLLAGRQRIGIVTENRRLARRVRALLERAGVPLEDGAGWALSTTSAAAVLERWLQCVEEDFPHQAMLDLLKSPFFCHASQRERHLAEVFRLEQDVVLHENIGSGLQRYRQHLRYRQDRLRTTSPDLAAGLEPVAALLERLSETAAPLQQALASDLDAGERLDTLLHSLAAIGITPQLADDDAGMRLLEEMQKMAQAVHQEPQTMSWLEFRNWLGRSFERYSFQPPATSGAVSLTALAQTPLAHFDGLILAGVEREHLPGGAGVTPFFNDAVRRELGLPVADEQLAVRYHLFRRLLEAAPQLLLTHRAHNGDEAIPPSPWLELLQAFHRLAYGGELKADTLSRLLADERTRVVNRERPLPAAQRMPRPALPAALLPQRYSASAYQQLIDCPYQFFAARGLGLAAPESIREALEKSDYGQRVHRCLEALHSDVRNLPGPYSGGWEPRRRREIIALLEQISHTVFARDLEDNFLHRGWLQRWLEQVPGYVDWQLEHASHWRVEAVEQQVSRDDLAPGLTLHGRLDRSDSDGEQLAIIDYKTGRYAKAPEVLSGEKIQLPFYALLAQNPQRPVARVEYLSLDEKRVQSRSALEGETLEALTQQNLQRLNSLQQAMAGGQGLPAWGDDETCQYCPIGGVCRRQSWQEERAGITEQR